MKTKKKQQQISVEEYIQTYCQEKRIRQRYAVYVSPDMHKKLKKISHIFRSDHHTTIASHVDAILTRHLEAHSELLNDAYQRHVESFFEPKTSGSMDKPDETYSESSPDDDSEH